MLYDGSSGKIKIGLFELVSIAARGISPTAPRDEEESARGEGTKRQLEKQLGKGKEQELIFGFDAGEYSFELYCIADRIENGKISVLRKVDRPAKRISKQQLKLPRAELFVLGYVYASISNLKEVALELVVLSEDGEVIKSQENVNISKLKSFFDRCVAAVKVFARPECERVTERLPSMQGLKFPYSEMREGQRDFIRAAYRNIARGTTLYATAPTGTGKTVSALYPAIKALGDGRVKKVFYLTPKTTTREAVRECLALMSERGAKIRAVCLEAKDSCCKRGVICREDRALCPCSSENKLPEATLALYAKELTTVDKRVISEVAEEYRVCPYELSLWYSEICDIVICDLNYLFDPAVYIRRFFTEGGDFAFLIDEAHNLPERAREIYSAELSLSELDTLLENPLLPPPSPLRATLVEAKDRLYKLLFPYLKDELTQDKDGKQVGATHLSYVPDELYSVMYTLTAKAEEEVLANNLSCDEEKGERGSLLRQLLYKLKKHSFALSSFDTGYRLFLFYESDTIRFKLFCVDTGALIRERIAKGHGAVFFSATLSPISYYKSVLGADGTAELLELPSPFESSQLSVSIMDKISTRYSERERTASAVCRAIAATVSAKRGNYMVFAPSFEYLELLSKAFSAQYPKIRVLTQKKDMTREEKADFLAKFNEADSSYLIGFCVLGGIYSEGVDLAGDRLIGAVVVGIGMPSLSYEREAMTEYYDDRYDSGKLFAYIYPGMNRVLQAAGRVIRRENDKGAIVLIDDRFDDPVYKKLIPDLWRGMRYVEDAKALNERLKRFWAKEG